MVRTWLKMHVAQIHLVYILVYFVIMQHLNASLKVNNIHITHTFWVHCLIADLYYGGDTFSVEQPQSFTCPYCGKMGFTETSLQEHVTSEHAETSTEVVSMLQVVEIIFGWAVLKAP